MTAPIYFQMIFFVLMVFCSVQADDYARYCSPRDRYRTLDGFCNNLQHPTWGMANTLQKRFVDYKGPMVDYADGSNTPRGYKQSCLPSAREVTNVLMDGSKKVDDQFDKFKTGINMAWGQFLTHDIIDTKLHSGVPCCNMSEPNRKNIDICFKINVPKNDKVFKPGCKSFNRAVRGKVPYGKTKYREQISMISSYIDATFLYGTTEEQHTNLREPNSFLMKTDKCNLLPTIDGGSCLKLDKRDRCPQAGDHRVGEAPNLGLLHVLFLREHNYIATKLHMINPKWDNERVFQEARRIIIAITQHVTYNEYLPSVISNNAMKEFCLFSNKEGFFKDYNNKIDASIRNVMGFALRFGHSQVMPTQSLLHRDLSLENFKVENTLMSPHVWQTQCGKNIPGLSRWLSRRPAMKADILFSSGIKDKLFFINMAPGLDLPALNIQRGRDHGTPVYNRWREFCGLRRVKKFSQFGKNGWKLAALYKSVDDVDFYVGALLEKGKDGRVGPTFECILARQFYLLKTGDRFWYETDNRYVGFTQEQLNSIRTRTTLSRIYCRNFGLKKLQSNIFLLPTKENPLIPCDELPEIDLSLWRDGEVGSGDMKYDTYPRKLERFEGGEQVTEDEEKWEPGDESGKYGKAAENALWGTVGNGNYEKFDKIRGGKMVRKGRIMYKTLDVHKIRINK